MFGLGFHTSQGSPENATFLVLTCVLLHAGTSEEEREFAFKKFGFEFDVYDKIDVNGPAAHPLYQYLKKAQTASQPGSLPSRPNGEIGAAPFCVLNNWQCHRQT